MDRWRRLRHLQLGSVYGGNHLTWVPESLAHMPRLEELDLSNNLLARLPTNMAMPTLLHLNVSKNQLEAVPSSVGQCRRLRTLNVSKNHLTTLPVDLVHLSSLELLDISENLLCIVPADLLECMKTTLLITGNPVTRPGHCGDPQHHPADAYGQILQQMSMPRLQHQPQPLALQRHHSHHLRRHAPSPLHDLLSDDDDDGDARIDRELSMLAQQLNVNGSRHEMLAAAAAAARGGGDATPLQDDMDVVCAVVGKDAAEPPAVTNILHSLRELATRVILQHDVRVPLHMIPPHLANDLTAPHRYCTKCALPFVNEWLTSVQVKSYRGHPAVVRRVRFCSTRCWHDYLQSRSSSMVCVHRPETQSILRASADQEEDEWRQASMSASSSSTTNNSTS
ncbi:hypothetical protein BC940DRAFT_359771 [Gongronella butleri]|nr:hypothetical protein BC940DRAFT_359771 [Gongronella butleri]